jgi:hypothetical protein
MQQPQFLNVLVIKKLAVAKGCTAERTATIKYKHYVRLIGPDGGDIPGVRGVGLGLAEAKRKLEAMPDRRNAQGLSANARDTHTPPKSGAIESEQQCLHTKRARAFIRSSRRWKSSERKPLGSTREC